MLTRLPVLLALGLVLAGPGAALAQTELLGIAAERLVPSHHRDLAQKRRPPIDVATQVGFDYRGRGCQPGTWSPAVLWVRNNTENELFATARLTTVNTDGNPGGSRVTQRVRLPPHTMVVVRSAVYPAPSDTRLEVQVSAASGEQGSDTIALLNQNRYRRAFVVLGAAEPGPGAAARSFGHDDITRGGTDGISLNETYPLAGTLSQDYGEGGSRARWMALMALPGTMPERWSAYAGVRGVVIADPKVVHKLNDRQWLALHTFVRAGGQLVVEVASAQAAKDLLGTKLEALCPAVVDPVAAGFPVDVGGELGARGEVRAVPMKLKAGRPAELKLPQELNYGGRTIAATQAEGMGQVTMVGISLGDPALTRSDRYPHFLRSVLETLPGAPIDAIRQPGAAALAKQVDYELRSERLAQIPSQKILLGFLLSYCLLVSPIGRAIGGKLKRPLIPWLILPLIVMAFMGIATAKLSVDQPKVPLLREMSVVQARTGDKDGLLRAYLSLYSPHQANFRIEGPDASTTLGYLSGSDHRGLDRELLAFGDGAMPDQLDPKLAEELRTELTRFRLDALPMSPRSSQNLEGVAPVALGGGFTLVQRGDAYTVRNDSAVPIEGGVLVPASGATLEVPAVAPGAEIVVSPTTVRPSHGGLKGERKVIDTLLSTLQNSRSRPLYVGWARRSLARLACSAPDGKAEGLSHTALTFVVIHPRRMNP